jgi:hypothetical protein
MAEHTEILESKISRDERRLSYSWHTTTLIALHGRAMRPD